MNRMFIACLLFIVYHLIKFLNRMLRRMSSSLESNVPTQISKVLMVTKKI